MKPSFQFDTSCRHSSLQPALQIDDLLLYLQSLRESSTTRSSYVTQYSLHFMPTFQATSAGSISSTERANLMAPELLDRGPSISDLDISRRTRSNEGAVSPSRRITVFSKSEVFGKYIKHRPRESKILPNASSISRMQEIYDLVRSRNFENSHLDIQPQHTPKSISPVHTIEDGDAKYTQGTPAPFEFAESRENTGQEKHSQDFSQLLKTKLRGEELKRRLTEFREEEGKEEESSKVESKEERELPLYTDQASELNIAQQEARRSGRKLFRSLLSYSRPQSSQNYESLSVQNIALDESEEFRIEEQSRQVWQKKEELKPDKTEEAVALPLHEVEEEPRTKVELEQEQRLSSQSEMTQQVIQIQRCFRDFQARKKKRLRSLHDHPTECLEIPSNQRTPPKPTFYELEVIKKKEEWKMDKPTHHIKMMMMSDPQDQYRSLSPSSLLQDPSFKLLIKRDRSQLPDLTAQSRWIASSETKQPRRSSLGGRVIENTFYPHQISVVAKLNRCGKSMPTLQDKRFKAGGVKGSLVLSPNVVASGPLIAPNKRDFKPVTHYPFRKKALLKSSILQAAKEVKKVYVEQPPVLKERSTASTRPSHSSYRSGWATKVLSDHYGMRSDFFTHHPSSSQSRFAKTRSQNMPLAFPNNSRAGASDSSSLGGKRTCYSDDPLRISKAYNGLPSIHSHTQAELKERMDKYSSLAFPQLNVDQGFSCLYKYKPQV